MLYLDLDGVFANFNDAVLKETGLSFKHGHGKEIFGILEKIPNFFLGLSPLPGSKSFFEELIAASNGDDVAILTAMPLPTGHFVTTKEDKKAWVAKWLSPDIPVICTDGWKGKLEYATHPTDILVDDAFRNIEAWSLEGSYGIWHYGFESNKETVRKVKEAYASFR